MGPSRPGGACASGPAGSGGGEPGLSAPRQTAFGSGVSVGDCRFSSPGVVASPHNVLKFFGYCNDFDREVRKCLRNEDLSLSPKLECSRVIVTHGSLQLK
ncbi:COX assembly mitochondrial protein 2 homolog isoform X2 [Rhinopithecus roxellana]|uniref:COX assembly mitochondrial protein 2 homolog isoform X2 n=1 Tax=Rhinopithecus roxellana TaxID=61622 RepID=UPI00123777CE|nr:COX assembly mitochondrial protein 2 homolog isoform X2 [Rhinopithecus roxellana]